VAGQISAAQQDDESSLQELAESIRAQGLMQLILARPVAAAGTKHRRERRWRAAMLAAHRRAGAGAKWPTKPPWRWR
jgi:ParB family chromosome partitioning protein